MTTEAAPELTAAAPPRPRRPPSRYRVPVRTQLGGADCGAACLAMVLTAFGAPTTTADVVTALAVGRDGLSAADLVTAGRAAGLAVAGHQVRPEVLLDLLAPVRHRPAPLVAHWAGEHFVVVVGRTRRGVLVHDPAVGRAVLTEAEFVAGTTGTVLSFDPVHGVAVTGMPHTGAGWWRPLVCAGWRAGRRAVLGVLLAALALQLVGAVPALLSGLLVDHVVPQSDTALHARVAWFVAAVGIGWALVALLRVHCLVGLRRRVDAAVTPEVVDHLLSLPHHWFDRRGTADVMSRVGGLTSLRELVTGQVVPTLLDGPMALGYLAVVLWVDLRTGLVVLAVAAVQAGVVLGAHRRVDARVQRELATAAAAEGVLWEAVSGIATVKAAGLEHAVASSWQTAFTAALNDGVRSARLQQLVDAVLGALRLAAPAVLLWTGIDAVLRGSLTLGAALAVTTLAVTGSGCIASVLTSIARVQTGAAHLQRLGDVLASAPEQTREHRPSAPPLTGALRVSRLGLRHDPRGPWVVRGVNLDVQAGSVLAVVGRSGSGKTTLARALLGMLEPAEGEIRYDGVCPAEVQLASLRRQLGVVDQHCVLFTGTVADNITLGRDDITRSDVEAAARTAALHDDVMAMPLGYDTVLREGYGVSGGQRQRIALARALAGRPRLLLLDEATSALDSRTESEITGNLAALDITRVVVAHRLSTVRGADSIVVLDHGRVVEQGRHDELVARGGAYAGLVAEQQR